MLARSAHVDAVIGAFGHEKKAARKIIIVGGGNVGLHLARTILREFSSVDVKLIERDRERAAEAAREFGDAAIVLSGDALDGDLLAEAQAGSADAIVAVTNDDEANIFVSVLAKQAGCRRAITLVNKSNYESLIPTLGIDAVVSPSAVTISTVLRHVRHGTIFGLYTLREDFGEVVEAQVDAGSRLLRRPLGEQGLPSGIKIGAVIRDGEVIMPEASTKLEAGDHVVALVAYSYLRLAEALLGARRRRFG